MGQPAAVAERPAAAEDPERPTLGGAITGLVNRVLAKPPVRKIARDLGIDLADVIAHRRPRAKSPARTW